MEVGGHLHALAALAPEDDALVQTRQEAGR
jgi:hypothetical protein